MGPVGVGVGEDHDLAVAAVTRLQRGHHPLADGFFLAAHGDQDALDLSVLPDAVVGRPEDVEDLAPDGEHRLEGLVPGVTGGPEGRVALHDEQFSGINRLSLQAVVQLARQRGLVEDALLALGVGPAPGRRDARASVQRARIASASFLKCRSRSHSAKAA